MQLEKIIWTHEDFEIMGWHDNRIYAMGVDNEAFEFFLDIDYIIKWIEPKQEFGGYKFWISPCTLVFENAFDIEINLSIDGSQPEGGLEISNISKAPSNKSGGVSRLNNATHWDWTIETEQGDITFTSTGYTQYIRKLPILIESQTIDRSIRGPISFGRELQ